MNTKKAVEWIFDIWHEWENIYGSNATENLKSGHKLDQVIDLLKRGEKYEAMCKEVEGFIGSSDITLSEFINIEQKYFPKLKKAITWEESFHKLEEESKEREEQLIKEKEYWHSMYINRGVS